MSNTTLHYDEKSGLSYQLVIGIETHIQVASQTKAFCHCQNSYGGMPNTRVCPICLGLPGAMPVVNQRLFEAAILTGLAFGSDIAYDNEFVRKNYMYPDLTKGYQITQKNQICTGGLVIFDLNNQRQTVRLVGLHMEEDVGKSLHIDDGTGMSYIDYNRCGAPLLEIVSAPDLASADAAVAYTQALREIVRHLGVSNGDMEEGSLRCDANINLHIHKDGQIFATPIAEIKNMNSFKSIRQAIAFEVQRQLSQWQKDGITLKDKQGVKTTRSWNDKTGETIFMRSKGPLDDYRFLPEQDLSSVQLSDEWIAQLSQEVGELPLDRRDRFAQDYGLSAFDCETLTASRTLADYYEQAVEQVKNPKRLANWLLSELLAVLNTQNKTIEQSPISAMALAQLVNVIDNGEINGKQAKQVFEQMVLTGKDAVDLVQQLGLQQVTNEQDLRALAIEVLGEFPQAIIDYRAGKDNALKFLMGQLMKKSKGKANPETASQLLVALLADA